MTDTTHHASAPLQDDAPRRGATPLLWILLVLAVLAFGWWLLAQRGIGDSGPGGTVTVTTPDDAQAAASAASEGTGGRSAATARARGTPAVARATATATAANRTAALLAHAQPAYPVAAARRGAEGTVMLQIAIDANGVPTDVGYAQRSGDADLDRAARSAARDWRFRPAMRNGRAVATRVNVPVRFILPSAQG
jgi:protein TonB